MDTYGTFFPTCQVRVARFYVSCRLLLLLLPPPSPPSSFLLPPLLGAQPRPSTSSVHCRTSTTSSVHVCSLPDLYMIICAVFPAGPQPRASTAQCSLPDLNRDHPRPVFPAGPQPRPSTPSVPCRTSTATIHAPVFPAGPQPRPVFPAGPQPRPSTPSVPCRTSTTTIHAQCSLPDLNHDH